MSDEVFRVLKPKRRRRWRFLRFFLFFYLIALGSAYLIFWTPLFKIRTFESSSDLIKNLITGHLLTHRSWWAKLLTPANLFFWSPYQLANFKAPVFISDLELNRDFYERKVAIKFQERQPLGVWCSLDKSNCIWFDKEGVLFAPAPLADGFLIPKVFDVNEKPAVLAPEVMDFLKIFPEILIKNSNLQEAEAKISNGPKIYLSLRFKMENLAGVLSKLSQELKWEKLEYIDLRVPNRVYYK